MLSNTQLSKIMPKRLLPSIFGEENARVARTVMTIMMKIVNGDMAAAALGPECVGLQSDEGSSKDMESRIWVGTKSHHMTNGHQEWLKL